MAPISLQKRPNVGVEKVRERLLTALHLGRLGPGDRVTSVRRLADMTGMNRKTVHRAYRALVEEGFLSVRPGAGTFVAPGNGPGITGRSENDLVHALNRCRAEGYALGLEPSAFADFVHNGLNGGLEGLPLAIVECNHEQIAMIARDVKAGLRAAPRAVLLDEFVARPETMLSGAWGIVTTDCHRAEVERAAGAVGAPVYRVALEAEFPRRVLHLAMTRGVVLCIRDPRFARVFLRFLGQLGASPDVLARIVPVAPSRLRSTLRRLPGDPVVIVSPLAEPDVAGRIPESTDTLTGHWRLADGTIDRLRAAIAFDLAARRKGHAS